jgi:hypothetical protein
MTSLPVLFVSIGFPNERDRRYPRLDKVAMHQLLRTVASCAAEGDYRLVIRNHPAVAPMIEAIMEEKPENLTLVSEHAPMSDIASQHKFAAVVFMGGGLQSLEDFSALVDKKSITLLSLPGTGGAAHLIEEEQKARGITSFIVKGAEREDPFGFDRLYRLITCMQYKAYPLPKAPKPGGPRP